MLLTPSDGDVRAVVLALHGSSGRPPVELARLLADHGAAVLAPRWFDAEEGICEHPLEAFSGYLDELLGRFPGRAAGIIGISKGAEAALQVAVRDERVAAVTAI